MSAATIRNLVAGLALGAVGLAALMSGGAGAEREVAVPSSGTSLPGFTKAVFLSHVNNPRKTPGFPGDPPFVITTSFTVPQDGFFLQYLQEGEHTGTHYSAPCHFHTGALCSNQLAPTDFILPLVVVDVREQVKADVHYRVTVADLKAWIADNGAMPSEAAVVAWTGCGRFWGPNRGKGLRTYYNCGTGRGGFHWPGFSLRAVRWLVTNGVLGKRGALGTDTFGPDPSTDAAFRESALTLRRHRLTLENLTNLDRVPESGAWLVVGGPRNSRGSGAQAPIVALVP